MPLDFRPIHIPLGVGLNTGANALTMEPPGLTELVNGRINKDGAIEKRPGYAQRALTGRATKRLFSYGGKLLAVCDTSTGNRATCASALIDNETAFHDQGLGPISSALSEAQQSRITVSRDAIHDLQCADYCYLPTAGRLIVAYEAHPTTFGSTITRVHAQALDGKPSLNWAAVGENIDSLPVILAATDPSAVASNVQTYQPRCVAINVVGIEHGLVVYSVPSGNDLFAEVYSTLSDTWQTTLALATDLHGGLSADAPFDAVSIGEDGSSDVWFLAYRTNAVTPTLCVKRFLNGMVTHTITIAEDPGAVALRAITGGVLWVAWHNNGEIHTRALSLTNLTNVLATTTIALDVDDCTRIGIACLSTTKVIVVWSQTGSSLRPYTQFNTVTTAGVTDWSLGVDLLPDRQSIILESRPMLHDGLVYAVFRYDGSSGAASEGFSSLLLISIARASEIATLGASGPEDRFRVVAQTQLARATGGRGHNHVGMLRSSAANDAPIWFATDVAFATAQLRGDGKRSISFSGIDLATWVTGFSYPYDRRVCTMAPMSREALFSGAVPMVYDGQLLTEHYFLWPPENAVMELNVGGGDLSAGDYQVAIVWEYRTNAGDRMQSPPVLARTSGGDTQITAAANDSIEVELPGLSITQKCDGTDWSTYQHRGVVARLYRTTANGDVFYLDPSDEASAKNVPYDETSPIELHSETDDQTLETNEVLYTVGGELEHYPFPALDFVATHDNRWFGIPSDDPYAVVFSSAQVPGEVPWHHPQLEIRLDEDGPNVALASLDDKLVVFKRSSVWVILGQGPGADGTGATYTAQRIASAEGCIEKRSVIVTQDGAYFQGRAGIYLVNRGLSVALASGPVDRIFDGPVTIMSATLVADRQEIYWTARRTTTEQVDDTPTSVHTPLALVHNVQNRQWSIDYVTTSDGEEGGELSCACYHASYFGGFYHMSHGDSPVYIHAGFADPSNVWIPLRLTTAWIKLAGIQGYQRVRWLGVMGERARPVLLNFHEWNVRVGYDYELELEDFDPNPVWAQEHTFTAADIVTGTMKSHTQRLHLARQKCQSIIVQVEDQAPEDGDPVEGAKLVSLVLDVGLKGRLYPAPQTNMQRSGA